MHVSTWSGFFFNDENMTNRTPMWAFRPTDPGEIGSNISNFGVIITSHFKCLTIVFCWKYSSHRAIIYSRRKILGNVGFRTYFSYCDNRNLHEAVNELWYILSFMSDNWFGTNPFAITMLSHQQHSEGCTITHVLCEMVVVIGDYKLLVITRWFHSNCYRHLERSQGTSNNMTCARYYTLLWQ